MIDSERVAHFLAEQVGAPVTIEQWEALAGGASMETVALLAHWGGQRHRLVLRRDAGRNMFEGALSRAAEFALLARAHAAGVRVPEPLFLHDAGPRPFFLMRWLPGTSVGPKVVRDPALAPARTGLAAALGRELAKIHALPPAALPFLAAPSGGRSAAEEGLRLLDEAAARLDPANPVWAFGLRWLERHLPGALPPVVLHGDFRVGNLLVTADGLSGVIDWEFAHLGDPAEDLAWPLVRDWRFGNDALHVGGIGTLDDFLAGYAAAGGEPPSRARLHWWEVAGNLRWAIFALAQAERHLSGADPSVELASLGRKSAEMEWELLRLIGG